MKKEDFCVWMRVMILPHEQWKEPDNRRGCGTYWSEARYQYEWEVHVVTWMGYSDQKPIKIDVKSYEINFMYRHPSQLAIVDSHIMPWVFKFLKQKQ